MKKYICILLLLMSVALVIWAKPNICMKLVPKSCCRVDEMKKSVTLTTFWATEKQCDSMPLVTATGLIIDTAANHRYVAISRDLEKLFPMNSYILIEDAGHFNGVYKVVDRTNSRLTNTIDVFTKKVTKLHNVKISTYDCKKTD